MHIGIPDDYQDAVRHLSCFSLLHGHDVTIHRDTTADPAEFAHRFGEVEALVLIRERTSITDALLDRLPKLRFISQTGRGTSHIDLDACARRGVVVSAGTGSPFAPAELAFALMLDSMRRITAESVALRAGQWQTGLGRTLRGRLLGIYGFGKIGALVAGFARAFGMHVLAFGRQGSRERAAAAGFAIADSKEELFETADVVSLHLRLSRETRGIVTASDLARMKTDALLVNTARGELIEEGALLEALKRGRPGFAALDVFDDEPLPSGHPLRDLPNVLCTPHLGYVEKDSYELYFGQAFEHVIAFANGAPVNVVATGTTA